MTDRVPADILAAWGRASDEARPVEGGGLVNDTWVVGDPPALVLQRLHPVFHPDVNLDVEAVTARLAEAGLPTPRLVRTGDGAPHVLDAQGRCWRALSYVPGRTVHRVADARQAASAGAMLGRFHAALHGWEYEFRAPRRNAHDTPRHMATLRAVLEGADGHPLEGPAREVGQRILDGWWRWEGEVDLPERLCHGDPKISNFRFDDAGEAVALIDLDTVGPQQLAAELGDAWRSWCNPGTEDDLDGVRFDVERFEASLAAWFAHAPAVSARERASFVGATERICLELAARFCADAIRNDYFREDRARFPQPGAHNLLRARAQLALADSVRAQQAACLGALVRAARGAA